MRRRPLLLAAGAVLLLAAALGLWRAAQPRDLTAQERVRAVATGLRCPTCAGQSVADSQSEMAQGMRVVVGDQLAQGRTPAQVRSWFAERYGDGILLDPPWRGMGLVAGALPLLVLGAGAGMFAVTRRRATRATRAADPDDDGALRAAAVETTSPRRNRAHRRPRWTWVAAGVLVPLALLAVRGAADDRSAAPGLVAAVDTASSAPAPTAAKTADPTEAQVAGLEQAARTHPGDADAWLAVATAHEQHGDYADSVSAYQRALALRPDTASLEIRLAVVSLKASRPADADRLATQVLARTPGNPTALLVLGLAQRAQRAPDADATLRRFLQLAPQHPAAAQVRALLGSG